MADDYVTIRVEPKHVEILKFKRKITPEPYGLKAAKFIYLSTRWMANSLEPDRVIMVYLN